MIWEGEEPSTIGVNCCVGFDGTWIKLMSSYSGSHLWVPGESPSDQRQPRL